MSRSAPQPRATRVDALVEALELDGGALCVEARVPADLACFEGHFPGSPVLPGFVQLHWVAEFAREQLRVDPSWTRIEALKFRAPLLPGDAFSLRIEAGPPLRFSLHRGGVVVSEGRLVAGGPLAPRRPGRGPAAATSPLPLRIPQQGPSRLISQVLSHSGGATLCRAEIPGKHPLLRAGRAPVWLALELLAQGMAAQGGLALHAQARRAFVVGARRIDLRTPGFRAGETLWVRADHARGESGLVVCDCALGSGRPPETPEQAADAALARGRLTAFVEPDPAAAASATSS